MDFKSTLNLPDAEATIPMKANLGALEPQIQARWAESGVYDEILACRADDPLFILHDGPPYTNSAIHLGTALNKILKDFVVKSRTMMGFRCPYVPGFDNHGLPIEQAVTKKLKDAKVEFDGDRLRKEARLHAQGFIEEQTRQFQRLGVLGRWDRPYATMDPRQEAEVVRVFGRLVEKGLVYRGLKPTQWSPALQTALADTEIVYKDHVSIAIHVAFPMREDPDGVLPEKAKAVIWTTTPWTIPANLAVAFHPAFDYAVVQAPGGPYLVLPELLEKVALAAGWTDPVVSRTIKGADLENVLFSHPVIDRASRAVLAEYVTTEDGTGIVHTAPSHGREDFMTGQKYGLPTPNTVDARGVLTEEAGPFAGVHFKACDTVVVVALREAGALLASAEYRHQYPYGERDETPVIFRATEQWFVSIDPLRTRMLEEIGGVKWIPASGQNRIEAMVGGRPDWCVSRQRPWGVGIPVFYGSESGEPVLDPVAIEAVAKVVAEGGSDAWFPTDPSDILPPGYTHPVTGETSFRKETDTLDVWFDSGSTSLTVLDAGLYREWSDLRAPADLYLEGSDQHRGWFNTSLILSTAVRDAAPYRAVLTHGFVTDDKGRKMSKRLGNVIDPVKAAETYGADVLRMWVASVNYHDDAPCSEAILKQAGEAYRTLRNTLRFLMGVAGPAQGEAPRTLQTELDRWILARVETVTAEVALAFEEYRFADAAGTLLAFCRDDLSRFYLDAIKDRMYCDPLTSPEHGSGAAACARILERLVVLAAPLVPHTAVETWEKMGRTTNVLAERWPHAVATETDPEIERLKALRETTLARFEAYKGTDGVKDSQNVQLTLPDDLGGFTADEVATLLKVGGVKQGELGFQPSPYKMCERSRLRRADVAEVEYQGEMVDLTRRDREALGLA